MKMNETKEHIVLICWYYKKEFFGYLLVTPYDLLCLFLNHLLSLLFRMYFDQLLVWYLSNLVVHGNPMLVIVFLS